MHPASQGNPFGSAYTKGSSDCITGKDFFRLKNYLNGSSTGQSGRVMIFR